jgi:hypothetical protein
VHATPNELSAALFDVSGDNFILGSSSSGRRGAAGTKGGGGGDDADVFTPLVLEKIGDDQLIVLLYKRLTSSSMVVAELLYRVVVAYGLNKHEAIAIYFEPIEQEVVEERENVMAANSLDQRRRDVMSNNFIIVSGRETGCLLLVSLAG